MFEVLTPPPALDPAAAPRTTPRGAIATRPESSDMCSLHLLGTLLGCSDVSSPGGLYCRWSLSSGSSSSGSPSWQLLSGSSSGTTHVDGSAGRGVDATWDHPLDMHLAVSSPVGWPRLRLELWSRDGKEDGQGNRLQGYGFAHVPSRPGRHDLTIATWRPVGGLSEKMQAFFLDIQPTLVDGSIVDQTREGEGRFGLKCETGGLIYVQLEVVVSGFKQRGVYLG